MKRIFIDCDIFLDLFLERQPFFPDSREIISQVEQRKILGFTSPLVYSNLCTLLTKAISGARAISTIQKLNTIFKVAPIYPKTVSQALASGFPDFEDALQNFCAVDSKINTLITRNIRDYKLSTLSVLSPEEFLRLEGKPN
jgi:predicted nucleic acid-binding protein